MMRLTEFLAEFLLLLLLLGICELVLFLMGLGILKLWLKSPWEIKRKQ